MIQGWDKLLSLLPRMLRKSLEDTESDGLRELRLRVGSGMELNYGNKQSYFMETVTKEDINFIINAASRYSPWQAVTMSQGYITAAGGHRIGICGEAVIRDGQIQGIRNPEFLCIRIARDVKKIGEPFQNLRRSILLLGPPGTGKTTLLRDIARQISQKCTVAVVDEREELFPADFQRGLRMDILRSCPKPAGTDMVLRTMGPDWICMDEITREEDTQAVIGACNCGVRLMATAHAFDLNDLGCRRIYRSILDAGVFENIVVLRKDSSYAWERREAWQ